VVAAEVAAGEAAVAVAEVAVAVEVVADGLEATTTPSATAGGKLLHNNSPFKQHETRVKSPPSRVTTGSTHTLRAAVASEGR
jgi:hypothetical protein